MTDFLHAPLPLEDGLEDMVEKAAWGRGLSLGEILEKRASGEFFSPAFWESLGLNVSKLKTLEQDLPQVTLPPELVQVSAPFYESGVNAWGLRLEKGAIMIDCGLSQEQGQEVASLLGLGESYPLLGLCLTHDHPDHTGGKKREKWGEEAEGLCGELLSSFRRPFSWGPHVELLGGAKASSETEKALLSQKWEALCQKATGQKEGVGEKVLTRLFFNSGHSPEGVIYALSLPSWAGRWALFTGDVLFARSLGKVSHPQEYEKTLAQIKTLLEEFAPETWICPGHGPATTVGEELARHPFF